MDRARETRYARWDDVHVAYRVFGSGPLDVVAVGNWFTSVEGSDHNPVLTRVRDRIGAFARLIYFDQPGSGQSDPHPAAGTLEATAGYLLAVLDHAEVERATLFGWDRSCAPAVLFAATHPERAAHLILLNPTARVMADDGYPGLTEDGLEQEIERRASIWGTREHARWLMPSMAEDDPALASWARYARSAASPGQARQNLRAAFRGDVRHLLPLVQTPTLVVRTRSPVVEARHPRYVADHIPGARYVELDSPDHVPARAEDFEALAQELQVFLTGVRTPTSAPTRTVATVVFTDIVASTERAAREGDVAWVALLDRHDAAVRTLVERHRGRYVRPTGDGALATFDGPVQAIRCAGEIVRAVNELGLDVRAGIHTGEIEHRQDDVAGLAVHIGARIADLARANEVVVSQAVPPLCAGAGLGFQPGGRHRLRGVPGEWAVFTVRWSPGTEETPAEAGVS